MTRCEELERERDEARERLALEVEIATNYRNAALKAQRERDEARDKARCPRCDGQVGDDLHRAVSERDSLREQVAEARDRLSEDRERLDSDDLAGAVHKAIDALDRALSPTKEDK